MLTSSRQGSVSDLRCEHFYRLLYSSRDTEKGGKRGKRHRTDKQNEVSSCAAWGYWVPHDLRWESSAYQSPPPPTHSPNRIIANFWQPQPKSRTASIWTAIVIMYKFSVQ
jgi:hypothetical protein